ncbi:MAG: DUF6762 family protein, partial [Anaerotignaceae bacterium]
MDETSIVIMVKDIETGFLEKELGSFKITEYENLIYNTFAVEENGKMQVFMKITTDRDVEDWEFDAIYDYYDSETILPLVTSISEEVDCFNPTWLISFDYDENVPVLEKKIDD